MYSVTVENKRGILYNSSVLSRIIGAVRKRKRL